MSAGACGWKSDTRKGYGQRSGAPPASAAAGRCVAPIALVRCSAVKGPNAPAMKTKGLATTRTAAMRRRTCGGPMRCISGRSRRDCASNRGTCMRTPPYFGRSAQRPERDAPVQGAQTAAPKSVSGGATRTLTFCTCRACAHTQLHADVAPAAQRRPSSHACSERRRREWPGQGHKVRGRLAGEPRRERRRVHARTAGDNSTCVAPAPCTYRAAGSWFLQQPLTQLECRRRYRNAGGASTPLWQQRALPACSTHAGRWGAGDGGAAADTHLVRLTDGQRAGEHPRGSCTCFGTAVHLWR